MERGSSGQREGGARYRIVVDADLPPEWARWFGVETLRSEGGRSTLYVTVTDQAQLHGILRRVHDVHLVLRSVHLQHHAPDRGRESLPSQPKERDHDDDVSPHA